MGANNHAKRRIRLGILSNDDSLEAVGSMGPHHFEPFVDLGHPKFFFFGFSFFFLFLAVCEWLIRCLQIKLQGNASSLGHHSFYFYI